MDPSSQPPTREDRLRARLRDVASRRLPAEAVEAVVREVLARVETPEHRPCLRAALRVLRARVVDYYASLDTPTLSSRRDSDAPLVAESLGASELGGACQRALRQMEEDSPTAAGYLRQLAGGASPDDVAGRVKIRRELLYQRLFRGRGHFDRLLVALGVRT